MNLRAIPTVLAALIAVLVPALPGAAGGRAPAGDENALGIPARWMPEADLREPDRENAHVPAENRVWDFSGEMPGSSLADRPQSAGLHRVESEFRAEVVPGVRYFGHRYYDPVSGRWLSREPLGELESPNLYVYVGNDPVNKVDVLGLNPFQGGIFSPVNTVVQARLAPKGHAQMHGLFAGGHAGVPRTLAGVIELGLWGEQHRRQMKAGFHYLRTGDRAGAIDRYGRPAPYVAQARDTANNLHFHADGIRADREGKLIDYLEQEGYQMRPWQESEVRGTFGAWADAGEAITEEAIVEVMTLGVAKGFTLGRQAFQRSAGAIPWIRSDPGIARAPVSSGGPSRGAAKISTIGEVEASWTAREFGEALASDPLAMKVYGRLREAGFEVRLVGGPSGLAGEAAPGVVNIFTRRNATVQDALSTLVHESRHVDDWMRTGSFYGTRGVGEYSARAREFLHTHGRRPTPAERGRIIEDLLRMGYEHRGR